MALPMGFKAPAFKLPNQNGEMVSLSDFKGKKLAIYFYPKDSTATCTVQACNLRDHILELKKAGINLIGVSMDSPKRHQNFIQKNDLPFPLLSDAEGKMVQDYAVWGEKKLYGKSYMGILRTTYLIDEKGYIAHVIDKVKSKEHAEQIIALWK